MRFQETTTVLFALLCGGAALIAGATLRESAYTVGVAYLLLFPCVVVMAKSRVAAIKMTDSGKSVSPKVFFNVGWSMIAVYSSPAAPLYLFASPDRVAVLRESILGPDVTWYAMAAIIILYWGTWIFKLSLNNGFVLGMIWVSLGVAGIFVLMSGPSSGLNHRIALVLTQALGSVMAVVTGLSHIHKRLDGTGGKAERVWYRYLNLTGLFRVEPQSA